MLIQALAILAMTSASHAFELPQHQAPIPHFDRARAGLHGPAGSRGEAIMQHELSRPLSEVNADADPDADAEPVPPIDLLSDEIRRNEAAAAKSP